LEGCIIATNGAPPRDPSEVEHGYSSSGRALPPALPLNDSLTQTHEHSVHVMLRG
jgi:hypothetical protein